ncbi:MAG: Alpha/beta hydrolase family protein [Actinobacteria bacterium ADurb.Bin444]|nr:MAG: Alpha/beta hydrolase family protein [Actinobacteria bacterium ADurb.Bin444]
MKRTVTIPGPPALEGIYETPDAPIRGNAVVSHPHPLYGGTMVNPVVHHVAKACRRQGLATVRFNFRGVGSSEGTYQGTDEWRDVGAAAEFVAHQAAGGSPLILAGYSFGARMSMLAALNGVSAHALILVAFPLMWEHLTPEAFDHIGDFRGPVLSILGQHDDVAPPEQVKAFFGDRGLEAESVLIGGTDHFFYDHHEAVEAAVEDFLARVLPTPTPSTEMARGEVE